MNLYWHSKQQQRLTVLAVSSRMLLASFLTQANGHLFDQSCVCEIISRDPDRTAQLTRGASRPVNRTVLMQSTMPRVAGSAASFSLWLLPSRGARPEEFLPRPSLSVAAAI